MADLSGDELRRYSRQWVMPEVTPEGQQRLKAARVLCVGAGGLGSPLALYLTAAGIGTLGLVDFDAVDLSNIQRQVLYSSDDVGRPKLDAALERLGRLNPHTRLVPHPVRLSADNVSALVADYDILVDGSDNFSTRYLLNDAAVLAGKPLVHASVFRFEGQLTVFDAARGPCLRCVFPEPPPAALVPSCAEGGVLGMLPGILGSLQALEVAKLALGRGEPLYGRLLLFDGLAGRWRELPLARDPACPLCGEQPSISAPVEFAAACAAAPDGAVPRRIAVEEAAARLAAEPGLQLLDVRESAEYAIAHIAGATLIPLAELSRRLHELDREQTWLVTCHRGGRALQACAVLQQAGFPRVLLLEGGVNAWAERIDPDMARY